MTREEAIQIIRETYHTDEEMKALESLIPELRESEDERIRKAIIEAIKDYWSDNEQAMTDCLAYLEKQKERKQIETTYQEYIPDEYEVVMDGNATKLVRKEQKPVDEKIVDEVGKSVRKKLALDFINYLDENRFEGKMNVSNAECKDIEEALFSSDWEKIYKYYNKYLQKPVEWSEEDNRMIGRIRGIIERYAFTQSAVDVNGELCEKEYVEMDAWLKSLHPSWKPSEEQMDALIRCIAPLEHKYYCILSEVYEQLKKL